MQATVDPAVRDCVGDKMHTLKAEHPEWSQEQRIAVALNMCGQGRGGDADAVFAELYGGQYQANVSRAVMLANEAQGIIRGYVFLWGSPNGENGVGRDSYDTYFDKSRPPNIGFNGDLSGYPVCIEHGLDPVAGKQAVGYITRNGFDEVGCWFEAQLDHSSPIYARTLDKIQRGDYFTSSSSAEHMADFYDDGAFRNWMLTEQTMTENPSQAEMPAVSLVRSKTGAEGRRDADRASHQSDIRMEDRTMNPVTPPAAPASVPAEARSVEEELAALVAAYGVDAVKAALDAMSASPDQMPADATMQSAAGRSAFFGSLRGMLDANKRAQETADLARRLDAIEAANKAANNAPPAPETRANGGSAQIGVSEPRKFWARSLSDLMFVHEVMKARGQRPSEDFVRSLAGRTATALEKNDPMVANPSVRSVLRGMRSDEIVTSTNSGNGDEWIGVAYSGTLWEKARSNRIFQELQSKGMRVEEVPDGHESTVIFTEGADPTVYTITQSADLDATSRPTVVVPVTAPGTGQVTLTPGYLGMAVAYTSVFEEDSLINASSQLNNQMQEKAEETIEQLFLNGDTASSTNVNYDGGTANAAQYFLASNGARKYALVTGSSTSRSGGALDENDYRLTIKLFPSAIRTRKSQMAFIIDSDTHSASLDIAAIKTDDVRRTNATITSGQLVNIYGVDVLESGFLLLTDTDGKVTYNAAGTVGQILAVYAPFWAMGWKRRVTFETDKDILAQSNLIVATFRLGFLARGAGAAVETYNLTV